MIASTKGILQKNWFDQAYLSLFIVINNADEIYQEVHLQLDISYRVGVRTSANTPYGSSDSLWRIGSANAAVLPLPVLAHPRQSLPCVVNFKNASQYDNL